MADNDERDDGLPWGYIERETESWRWLPKNPMLMANLGPPPFSVTLPSGEVRDVIHQPPPVFWDGWHAHRRGLLPGANPFCRDTNASSRDGWDLGFYAREAFAKKAKPNG